MLRRIVKKNMLCPVQIVHCLLYRYLSTVYFCMKKSLKKQPIKKTRKGQQAKQHKHKTRENSYIECAQKKDLSFLFHNKVNNKTGGYSKAILCFSHKVNTGNKIKVFKNLSKHKLHTSGNNSI